VPACANEENGFHSQTMLTTLGTWL
jgi:hypothetical protein